MIETLMLAAGREEGFLKVAEDTSPQDTLHVAISSR
jgi:hypothetical protein